MIREPVVLITVDAFRALIQEVIRARMAQAEDRVALEVRWGDTLLVVDPIEAYTPSVIEHHDGCDCE